MPHRLIQSRLGLGIVISSKVRDIGGLSCNRTVSIVIGRSQLWPDALVVVYMISDESTLMRIHTLVAGGFHSVYRLAMHQESNIVVKQVCGNEIDQLEKEVALLSQACSHASIIDIVGWSVSNFSGTVFGSLFMGYAAGGDLLEILRTNGPFGEGESIQPDPC